MMDEFASDIRQAHQIWAERYKEPEAVAEEAPAEEVVEEAPVEEVVEEAPVEEAVAEEVPAEEVVVEEEVFVEQEEVEQVEGREEEILGIIAQRPEGIRLVDIGSELGVNWRGLINVTKSLVDSGRVDKIETVYYPKKEGSEE